MPRQPFDRASVRRLVEAAALPGQPEPTFETARELTALWLGHRLFTVLAFHADSGDVERVYTSRPAEYPLRGRKRMGPTPWGERVLRDAHAWFGRGADDIRRAFPDHELILSLGCEECLSAPVRCGERVLGVVSALDAAGSYREEDLGVMGTVAAFLVPGLLESSGDVRPM